MFRLIVLSVCLAAAMAYNECSSSTYSRSCGGRYCPPEEAECVNNVCECTTRRGQNEMLCVNGEDFFASVVSDPAVWNINHGFRTDLPVPCMYLFSSIKTKTQQGSMSPNGECTIDVYLYNERVNGKMYVGGMEVKISTQNMQYGDKTLTFKVDGSGQTQNYCYNSRIKLGNGNWDSEFRNKMEYRIDYSPFTFEADPDTNRFFMQVGYCGFKATFRPADKQFSVHNQKWMPAFAMALDADNSPEFLQLNDITSLAPGQTFTEITDGKRRPTDELISRAFRGPGNAMTGIPNYTPKCTDAKNALNNCPSKELRTQALELCRFALESPPFVRCYSENPVYPGQQAENDQEVSRILDLYSRCVQATCQQNMYLCTDIKAELQGLDHNCKSHTPDAVLEMSCMYNVQ